MTLEARLQQIIGQQVFQIAALSLQLEQAQAKIAELEKAETHNPTPEE